MTETAKYAAPLRYVYDDDQSEPPRSKNLEIAGHVGLVTSTIPAAGPPPAGWLTLKGRLDQLQSALAGNRLAQRLTAAVLDGADPLGVDVLLSLAVSERARNIRADLAADIHAQVLARLHEHYQPVARSRYEVIAAKFDTTARRFAELAQTCDVEAPAEAILSASPQAQAAYREAPAVAAELDSHIPALGAAAELLGATVASQRASFEIPLTCDTTDADRRAVWLAWHCLRETREPSAVLTLQAMVTPPQEPVISRCGRWPHLLAAGVVVRACPTPETLVLFEKPRARFIQYTDENGRKLSPPQVIDPEARPRGPRALLESLRRRRHAEPDNILDTVAAPDDTNEGNQP
jgi:hypothetical protein